MAPSSLIKVLLTGALHQARLVPTRSPLHHNARQLVKHLVHRTS